MSAKKSTALLVILISPALFLETGCGTKYVKATAPTMPRTYFAPIVEQAHPGIQQTPALPSNHGSN
jgi:hypothetical protein